ncbi:hypothetical protein B0H10DRAFT_1950039 [Mycena sp. CBHHK59/15]|nr:hypothetical protein B0H10DRAFT_1950039 [Mycena sp. CBHHK59/15]
MPPNPRDERATFFLNRNHQIFFYWTYCAMWLEECAAEVEVAHGILVGDDLHSGVIEVACKDGMCGPHLPIIIGHHRQSSVAPFLTSWHIRHKDRVDRFLALPIVKHIIGWVSNVLEIVFPGIAAQFLVIMQPNLQAVNGQAEICSPQSYILQQLEASHESLDMIGLICVPDGFIGRVQSRANSHWRRKLGLTLPRDQDLHRMQKCIVGPTEGKISLKLR